VIDSENFTTRNIKIVNRKQQYHDDCYDLSGSTKHVLIENGFAMTMDDTLGPLRRRQRRQHGSRGYRREGICELHL